MESLQAWREFKARQKNQELCGEFRTAPRREISYMQIPMPGRVAVIARMRLGELEKKQSKGFKTDDQRRSFEYEKEMWFSWLKDSMKNYRLSKEFLADYGLNWNDCKRMAYGA